MQTFDLSLFLSTFAVVFVAELPDKTALAALIMATRSRPLGIFLGAAAAFVIQTVVAVVFGSVLNLLPRQAVGIGAGVLFILLAAWMWMRRGGADADRAVRDGGGSLLRTAWMSFGVIFVAEWGDLTQLATAALCAKYGNPVTIASAAILALWAVTGLAVVLGSQLKALVRLELLNATAAVVLAVVGILLIGRYR